MTTSHDKAGHVTGANEAPPGGGYWRRGEGGREGVSEGAVHYVETFGKTDGHLCSIRIIMQCNI